MFSVWQVITKPGKGYKIEMKKISIIIPIYNVEEYLETCLKSIVGQTYPHLEIILVDDGSPDNCPYICDQYAEKDKRIVVIHQKNQGLSVARNVGVIRSTGDYILFVDSDDFFALDFCEKVMGIVEREKCDIVIGEVVSVDEQGEYLKSKYEYAISEFEILSNYQAMKEVVSEKRIIGYAWGKLYKRELLKGVNFPAGKIYEDRFTLYKYFSKAERICLCPGAVAYYRMRKSSIVHDANLRGLYDLLEAEEEVLRFCKEKYPTLVAAVEALYFGRYVHIWMSFYDTGDKEQINNLVLKMKDIFKEYRKKKNIKMKHKVSYVMIFLMPSLYRKMVHWIKLDRREG